MFLRVLPIGLKLLFKMSGQLLGGNKAAELTWRELWCLVPALSLFHILHCMESRPYAGLRSPAAHAVGSLSSWQPGLGLGGHTARERAGWPPVGEGGLT